jgi:hypothetical protein
MFVVAIFMSLPAICLIYGWRVRGQVDTGPMEGGWRAKLLTLGLYSATLSLLVTSGFLFQGFDSSAQSFASPPPRHWVILNWLSALAWTLALLATVFGKGRLRRALFLWCVCMPLAAWMVIEMGYRY